MTPSLTRRELVDGFRESLFWLPLCMVAVGVLLGLGVGALSDAVGDAIRSFPLVVDTTVESRRTLLEVLAVATITVVGLVSSVLVIAVQLASSQFSPRVLRGFLRDRVSQAAVGTVIGTFAYCIFVLVANRPAAAVNDSNEAVGDLPATVALILAAASIIMIMAFIDNTARSMQVGRIIRRVADDTRTVIARLHDRAETEHGPERVEHEIEIPDGASHTVVAPSDGWVQQLDVDALLTAVPPGSTVRVELPIGKFAIQGTPLLTVWPVPDDLHGVTAAIHQAYELGGQRALRQDVAFGIRQLVDISLRALSPAINDPGTAYEVVSNLGAVLADLLVRDLPAKVTEDGEGRTLLRPHVRDHAAFVHLAFEQLRIAAAPHPAITVAILNVLSRLDLLLTERDLPDRREILREQARLVVEESESVPLIPSDRRRVRDGASLLDA